MLAEQSDPRGCFRNSTAATTVHPNIAGNAAMQDAIDTTIFGRRETALASLTQGVLHS
jgi:hypothetical protein